MTPDNTKVITESKDLWTAVEQFVAEDYSEKPQVIRTPDVIIIKRADREGLPSI